MRGSVLALGVAIVIAVAIGPGSRAAASTPDRGGGSGGSLDQLWNRCTNSDPKVSIDGCTALIASGQVSGKDLAIAFYDRGHSYHQMGKYKKAITDYNQAIRLDPAYELAFLNRCIVNNVLKRYDRAIGDCSEAIRLAPNDVLAYDERGFAHSARSEFRQALDDFNQSIRLDPTGAMYGTAGLIYVDRAAVYSNLKQYAKSIEDCGKAIALNSKLSIAYQNRALSYLRLKRYAGAIADFDQVIRLEPNDAWAMNKEARLLATLPEARYRDGEKAVALAERAVAIKDNAAHRDTLAAAYAEVGRFEDAVREEQAAIKALEKAGMDKYVPDAKKRLALYRQHKPYRSPPSSASK